MSLVAQEPQSSESHHRTFSGLTVVSPSRGIHPWIQGEPYGSTATGQRRSNIGSQWRWRCAGSLELPGLARTAYNLLCIAQPYRVAGLRLPAWLAAASVRVQGTATGPYLVGMGTPNAVFEDIDRWRAPLRSTPLAQVADWWRRSDDPQ